MSHNDSMYDEVCDKCGKSLFVIHPYDEFNCMCPDESHRAVFVFQEDEEARPSSIQLKDLEVGDSFIFRDERFTKRNDMGWGFGVCNIADEAGNLSHIHPTTRIRLIQ